MSLYPAPFERLVEQYQGPVLRMCVLTLRDKTLAEDATQLSQLAAML